MIEITHLTYSHRGAATVSDMTFNVRNGHACALLSHNTATTATVARLVAGCLSPSDGQVLINGYDVHRQPKAAKKSLAYLPSPIPTPDDMTPYEYIALVAELRGVGGDDLIRTVHDALIATNLDGVQDRPIRTLSPIAVRRLGLSTTLPGDPDTVILDNPMAGLNVKERAAISALIQKLCQGKTLLVTGAPFPEIQALSDQTVMMENGRCTEARTTAPQSTEEENA